MKKVILMAVAGVVSAVFAETTLPWVFEGYVENEAVKTETLANAVDVDTTVFVEKESAAIDISTEAPGLAIIVR